MSPGLFISINNWAFANAKVSAIISKIIAWTIGTNNTNFGEIISVI